VKLLLLLLLVTSENPEVKFGVNHDNPNGLIYRIYENGTMILESTDKSSLIYDMSDNEEGVYTYTATMYNPKDRLESKASNEFVVDYTVIGCEGKSYE